MIEENTIYKAIKCQCGCGGAILEGVEIGLTNFSDEKRASALTNILIWRRPGYNPPPRFRDRAKAAWDFFRGRDVYTTDITLDKKGVAQLMDACASILEVWPTDKDLREYKEHYSLTWAQIKECFDRESTEAKGPSSSD